MLQIRVKQSQSSNQLRENLLIWVETVLCFKDLSSSSSSFHLSQISHFCCTQNLPLNHPLELHLRHNPFHCHRHVIRGRRSFNSRLSSRLRYSFRGNSIDNETLLLPLSLWSLPLRHPRCQKREWCSESTLRLSLHRDQWSLRQAF